MLQQLQEALTCAVVSSLSLLRKCRLPCDSGRSHSHAGAFCKLQDVGMSYSVIIEATSPRAGRRSTAAQRAAALPPAKQHALACCCAHGDRCELWYTTSLPHVQEQHGGAGGFWLHQYP
jgi:hypothetical protein